MKRLMVFMCILLVGSASAQDVIENAIIKAASDVQSFFSTLLFDNCTNVKTFLGLTYNQLNSTDKTPDLSKLVVELHTATGKTKYNLSTAATDILASPNFDRNLPIAMYIHGFLSNSNSSSTQSLTASLVKKGNLNVLFLDASSVIYMFYLRASTCVQFIGEKLGEQLAIFTASGGVSPSNIHLLGHSLGAHISGFAGQTFTQITGNTIGKITGMDPAGPCFFEATPALMLSPTDADFVQAIHTDAGVFGIIKPLGHVDFYPNGGSAQPECLMVGASHSRSWELVSESILYGNNFPGVQCANWTTFQNGKCYNNTRAIMGYDCPPSTRGIYYMRTAGVSLFGQGVDGISAPKPVDAWQAFLDFLKNLFSG